MLGCVLLLSPADRRFPFGSRGARRAERKAPISKLSKRSSREWLVRDWWRVLATGAPSADALVTPVASCDCSNMESPPR